MTLRRLLIRLRILDPCVLCTNRARPGLLLCQECADRHAPPRIRHPDEAALLKIAFVAKHDSEERRIAIEALGERWYARSPPHKPPHTAAERRIALEAFLVRSWLRR